jgi:hypothetical protein
MAPSDDLRGRQAFRCEHRKRGALLFGVRGLFLKVTPSAPA